MTKTKTLKKMRQSSNGGREFGQGAMDRSRSDVEDDEYKEFMRVVSHDFDEPLHWSHNKVEQTGVHEPTVSAQASPLICTIEAPRG